MREEHYFKKCIINFLMMMRCTEKQIELPLSKLKWILNRRRFRNILIYLSLYICPSKISFGKDVEKRELCTAGGMQFGKAIMENGVGFPLKN